MEYAVKLEWDWKECALFNRREESFEEYKRKVFAALDKLQSNKYYDILVLPIYRRETFLGLCYEYMDEHSGYELSTDRSKIYNKN